MLARQVFLINADKDTQLTTLHGSRIRISAHSFTNPEVSIEIREAFTPAEILAAGMTTESNGRPLRSAGMIYINATANGDSVSLLKPIDISVPNQFFDGDMQLFKGVETDSGTVNWVAPEPMDTTPQYRRWAAGRAIFEAKCASCHRIGSDLTGPDLAGVEYRWRNMSDLHLWIKDWEAAVRAGIPGAQAAQYLKPTAMDKFSQMPDADIADVIAYIINEATRLRIARSAAPGRDSAFTDSLLATLPQCPDDTVYNNVMPIQQSFLNTGISGDSSQTPLAAEIKDLYRAYDDKATYTFSIKGFGWYNCDAFYNDPSAIDVELTARAISQENITMQVYLLLPRRKMNIPPRRKINNDYIFEFDEQIPMRLPIGERALVLMTASKGDKVFYGITEFTVQQKQVVEVQIQESTPDAITRLLAQEKLGGIDLSIAKREMNIYKNYCDPLVKNDTAGTISISPN